LFLVKVLASILDQSNHLLVKPPCKSACENLDATSARSAVYFLQPTLQLSKKSSCPALWLRFLHLHVFDVHQHKFNRSRAATLFYDINSRSRSARLARI